jgi:hypothetical protein
MSPNGFSLMSRLRNAARKNCFAREQSLFTVFGALPPSAPSHALKTGPMTLEQFNNALQSRPTRREWL